MYYAGGKKRIGKHIAEIIKSNSKGRTAYIEPFCGMLGVFRHMSPHEFDQVFLGDRNPAIIKMWEAAQKGWNPPSSCSKEEYLKLKNSSSSLTPDSIFCGFACSFRGSMFSTFCHSNNVKNQANHVEKISTALRACRCVKFSCGSYFDTISAEIEGAIIYLDPPYRGTLNKYQINRLHDSNFDYDKFLEWAVKMSEKNHVYLSEYANLPPPAKLVWAMGKEKLYKI